MKNAVIIIIYCYFYTCLAEMEDYYFKCHPEISNNKKLLIKLILLLIVIFPLIFILVYFPVKEN